MLTRSNENTYAGTTTVDAGTTLLLSKTGIDWYTIPGSLVINGTVRLLASYQFFYLSPVTINDGGLLDMNGYSAYIGALSGSGGSKIGLNGGYLYADYGFSGTSTFGGLITGSGTLNKQGTATLILANNNTYTGFTEVSAGTLLINGAQPQCPVGVDSSGILGGSGKVGTITANGMISPGNSPGILSSSNVTFTSTGNFTVQLTGPTAGTGYDQLNVTGTNKLANAVLTVIPAFTKPVAVGQQFVILNNDLSEAITGTFSGLPQGATITSGGYKFTISYTGGTGNDVVLTLTSVPAAVAGSAVASGNGSHGIDPNGCNDLELVINNTTGTPMTGITATLSTTTQGVLITQPYASYPNIPANGAGTNLGPFQISTLPSFPCGTPVNLQLSVNSSLGSFTMSYALPTGEPAAPVRYDNNIITNVPDIGTIESTNIVAAWSGGLINKVAVSLWLVAPYDSDLSLSLISPGGTTVPLSTFNGSGPNFGTGSGDLNRTIFDDVSGTAITAGTPPFVGTFRPQSPLSAFSATYPNGAWRLRIQDSYGSGSPDTLRGWSLFLYGTGCNTGSGICDYCLTSITGTITNTDLVQTDRIWRDGIVASSGAPKVWPGFIGDAASRHYDIYAFTNTMASDASVTVLLTSPGDLQAGVYLNAFVPSNISSNYLADSGDSTSFSTNNPQSCSASIPLGAKFYVTVNEVAPGTGGDYVLQVSGLPCPPPTLNIQPVASKQARLFWKTAHGGYLLESAASPAAVAWEAVTDEPIVCDGHYNVTNSCMSLTNRFYRLHKP